jgi:hypothetical protein
MCPRGTRTGAGAACGASSDRPTTPICAGPPSPSSAPSSSGSTGVPPGSRWQLRRAAPQACLVDHLCRRRSRALARRLRSRWRQAGGARNSSRAAPHADGGRAGALRSRALSVAAVRLVSALSRPSESARGARGTVHPALAVRWRWTRSRDAEQQGSVLERTARPPSLPVAQEQPRPLPGALARDTKPRHAAGTAPCVVKPGMRLRPAARLHHLLGATETSARRAHAAADTLYSADLVAGGERFPDPPGIRAGRRDRPGGLAARSPVRQPCEPDRAGAGLLTRLPPLFAVPPIIVNIPAFGSTPSAAQPTGGTKCSPWMSWWAAPSASTRRCLLRT